MDGVNLIYVALDSVKSLAVVNTIMKHLFYFNVGNFFTS